jgi:hypothetical protein
MRKRLNLVEALHSASLETRRPNYLDCGCIDAEIVRDPETRRWMCSDCLRYLERTDF